ncbi:MAG: hypothetical protein DI537_13990 [Stutzerimonas stutzeri]|nr:MAG: hypothetical protein DI537_13990 [Stutzerimonas stutzeri]
MLKPFTRTDIATRQVIRIETVLASDSLDAIRRLDAGEGHLVSETIGPALSQESNECVEGVAQTVENGHTGLIIVLEGGAIQSVVSTDQRLVGCLIRVVDYDEDEGDTSVVVQSDGKEIETSVWDLEIEKAEIEVKE